VGDHIIRARREIMTRRNETLGGLEYVEACWLHSKSRRDLLRRLANEHRKNNGADHIELAGAKRKVFFASKQSSIDRDLVEGKAWEDEEASNEIGPGTHWLCQGATAVWNKCRVIYVGRDVCVRLYLGPVLTKYDSLLLVQLLLFCPAVCSLLFEGGGTNEQKVTKNNKSRDMRVNPENGKFPKVS
ncbi:unnamed protein product, partial [Nesidiocoris tenuis]